MWALGSVDYDCAWHVVRKGDGFQGIATLEGTAIRTVLASSYVEAKGMAKGLCRAYRQSQDYQRKVEG